MKLAIYPGTFDPVTHGHLDILGRACRLFDEVVVAVAPNEAKAPLFNIEERIALLEPHIKPLGNAKLVRLEGLTVDFAKKNQAIALIRGLRAVSDFEFEFQMAQMNRHLEGSVETIFLMPNQTFFYTSSQIVKQVCRVDSSRLSQFVPDNVLKALKKKFGKK
ncbi:MAG TPA: pantetheine-phosphate adenylyltransferase [Opitutales bacterium]|jgi:pantetheine-phosphate adenylyltransferase|nr:pantetheine-phosphate adenylyltransferase [Opitutales bacterium]